MLTGLRGNVCLLLRVGQNSELKNWLSFNWWVWTETELATPTGSWIGMTGWGIQINLTQVLGILRYYVFLYSGPQKLVY